MAKIIGIGNRKGGAGKTTIANSLTGYLKYSGKYPDLKILAIDLDGLMSWGSMRNDDFDYLELQLEKGNLDKDSYDAIIKNMYTLKPEFAPTFIQNIQEYDQSADVIIIDMPGTLDQPGVKQAYAFLDILIVPTDVTRQDLNGTTDFLQTIENEVFPLRKEPFENIIGVLNKIDTNTLDYRSRKDDLEKNGLIDMYGFEFVRKPITNSKAIFGREASTFKLVTNAKNEVVFPEVFEEIISKLNLPTHVNK